MLLQFLVGFKDFDDYLIAFVFVLFLNDLYIKLKKPDLIFYQDDRINAAHNRQKLLQADVNLKF